MEYKHRKGVKLPDKGAIPPLVKWGNPNSGPYTWPVDATSNFGVRTAIVNLPPANFVSKNADIPMLFDRMIGMLKIMHDSNPSWGPLYVVHPGDIVALPAYYNHKENYQEVKWA